MYSFKVADEKDMVKSNVVLSEKDWTANRIGLKRDYITIGANTLEGRKETTVWKSLEEAHKYIAVCKEEYNARK